MFPDKDLQMNRKIFYSQVPIKLIQKLGEVFYNFSTKNSPLFVDYLSIEMLTFNTHHIFSLFSLSKEYIP